MPSISTLRARCTPYPERTRADLAQGLDPNAARGRGHHATAPLPLARGCGETASVRPLLEAGADVNLRTRNGRPALARAAERGYLDVMTLLFDWHADPNATDGHGRTALHHAVRPILSQECQLEALPPWLASGARVDQADNVGATPIVYAAVSPDLPARACVRLLLDHGAHVDLRTRRGQTVLHWAVSSGSPAVIRLLLAAGADAKARSSTGGSILATAEHRGDAEVLQIIREALQTASRH